MILKRMEVNNFRLLKEFRLDFKEELSLVIGKNNSGKTSVLIILDKMLNSSRIMWEDINLERQKELHQEIIKFNILDQKDDIPLEAINLKLFIEYSDKDSYTNIQKFMMDLKPENNIIVLEFVSLISAKKVAELRNHMDEDKINDFTLFSKFLSKNFAKFFEVKKYSRGFDVAEHKIEEVRSEEIESSDIQKLIKVVGVRADRAVSNDDRNHVLSSLTGKYFNSYKSVKSKSELIFTQLEKKLEEADNELYKIYNGSEAENGEVIDGVFSEIIKVIRQYGGAGQGIDIAIESSISEKNLLSDNTNLSYRQGNESTLPETYNGLGHLNLIGILFEIETKIQEIFEQPADINLLYIEEPEAHTHPQLQYIFIRNIKNHIESRKKKLSDMGKQLQVLITSHSSHIVSACNFDDVIYLKREENGVIAKNFNSLKDEYSGDSQKGFKFVKQYLTLNRSELFFTDKVVCVEGDTERILMPMMMYKVDKKITPANGELPLLSQNISIIEVGAHSHIFIPLFEFLGLHVLIITDIDAAKKREDGKYVKSHPQNAENTSNVAIKEFFKDTSLEGLGNIFHELVSKGSKDKIKKKIRIAYQIPEKDGEYQASSFEDAFIALNKNFIIKNKENFQEYGALKSFDDEEIINDYYNFAQKKVEKKSAFASSLLYFDNEYDGEDDGTWKVPYYIEEGLVWLRQS
ncbi:ATP-dependent nuclease [Pelistega europaea]|uniref:AAA family ATPase n=1 Tax=Pelistega europaea TaxID=106147 RepID=A0A7Y4LDQ0_9BURK|nr:AAA family ATPase [Pelistega europaea]NOL50542.1 AAA family ATPase [Pelistega europaea]